MINELVYEYVKHIRIPHCNEDWLIGPLNLDQYVAVLLIARANGFDWHIGYDPIELDQFFPIRRSLHRQQLVGVFYNLRDRTLGVGAFDFHLAANMRMRKVVTLWELMEEYLL